MDRSAPAPQGQVLLGVFAHPDDESLSCGGLLARCAAADAAVTVLCLTRGEGGPGGDAGTGEDEAAVRRRLGERRTRELDAAARVLGVSDLVVLDHADGMLPWIDAAVLEADIHRAVERLRPDVIVTFGPDGLYWHPDHISVYERTTAVVAAMGAGAPALYYVTMPPGQMRRVAEHVSAAGDVVPGLADPDAFGAMAEPPSLVVEAGAFAGRKLAAIRCHHSQMAGSPLAALEDGDAAHFIGTEHFSRAAVGASRPAFIDSFASSTG